LLLLVIFIFTSLIKQVSFKEARITRFELENVEVDENGNYKVKAGQEVIVIIDNFIDFNMSIRKIKLNGKRFNPMPHELGQSEKSPFIKVKFTIEEGVDKIILSDVKIDEARNLFFVKVNYIGNNVISLKIER